MGKIDWSMIVTQEQRSALAAAAARKAEFPNLHPEQFWFGLRAAGYEDDVRAWVATLNDPESPDYDPVGWAWASSKLEFATFFERDDIIILILQENLNIPSREFDLLWKFAASN